MYKPVANVIEYINKDKKTIAIVFAVAFIAIFAINGYFFMGFSLGHDSCNIAPVYQEINTRVQTTQGRFLADYINNIILQGLNMPFLTGIFECIHMALTSLVLLKILNIRSNVYSASITAILASSVAIISINCYIHNAYVYTLGILIASLGVYCFSKKGIVNLIVGIAMLTASLSLYQAHFVWAFSLCLAVVIVNIVKDAYGVNELVFKSIRLLFGLAIAMLLYMLIWEFILKINHLFRSSYLGMNTVGIRSIITMIRLIKPTYIYALKELFLPHFKSYIPIYINAMNILLTLYALVLTVKSLLKSNNGKQRLALFMFFVVISPCIVFFGNIMSMGRTDSTVVKFSFVIISILWVYLLYVQDAKFSKLLSIAFTILIFINSLFGGNITSTKRRADYEQGLALANQIITRVQNEPGYTPGKRVMFVGGEPANNPYSRAYAWCDNVEGANQSQAMNQFLSTMFFIKRLCPKMDIYANDPKYMRHDKVIDLDLFPAQNCVTVVDDIYIIRLANW